ncbi:ATP-binding protein [Psychrobium sp. 1_MG-2023]|uniref:ATP-binding protein n=1 Tax=Psychrobium sp. 1_MG-2023 TaxID=3062624 RepID=UPI000C32C283|nr:ATP-binding protein [Psychrobium sp. 1_MG-2023]MDP2561916.1 ATP-binding protein [Psychrobium sp. 1_MG-2023]PKF59670.1 two-component sensor histidine kinase [Alteromonadales bacterium alter-6D02]
MFRYLLSYLSLTIVSAIVFAALVLDPLYVQAIKQDELAYTRGINQVVSEDVFEHQEQQARLLYWADRFSYDFSLKKLADIQLPAQQIKQLQENGVFAEVRSGWAVDRITLYYSHPSCDCYLMMTKNYGEHGLFQQYLLSFLLIVVTFIALFILYYTYRHKKEVTRLTKVYQAYGQGSFNIRAESKTAQPYAILAKTFNQMAEQIEALLQEQRTLVHGVTHDLRTPIARLRFALDMTRNCQDLQQYQARLQDMDLDLDELDDLVNQWLFYAQVSSKPAMIELQQVAVVPLINHSLKKLSVLYPAIKVTVELQSAVIQGNEQLLIRAVDNLMMNAFKFAHSQIKVTVSQVNRQLLLAVEDDGPGIKDELHDYITQPFVRLDASRSTDGFGLGLAIVKCILDKHHTQLTIKHSPLGGACFMVAFNAYNH